MAFDYQMNWVALSVAIAILGAYTFLRMAHRLAWARPARQFWWIAVGALILGFGIWAMHFVGMLAAHLPVPVAYDPWWTSLSLLPVVSATAIALTALALNRNSARARLLAAVLMGLGIVAMHYSGMAALRMQPPIRYDAVLVAASVLIAVGASWMAMRLLFEERRLGGLQPRKRVLSAVLMGLAISGMHYIGMAAAQFAPDAVCTVADTGWDGQMLGALVGVVAVLVLLASLGLAFLEQILGENAFYRALLAAQSNAGEGLLVVAGGRVLYANEAMARISGRSHADLLALTDWRELVEGAVAPLPRWRGEEVGEQTARRAELQIRSPQGDLRPCEAIFCVFPHADGVRHLLLFIDVSERRAAEAALRAQQEQNRELALVASSTDNAVLIMDAQVRITWVNDGFVRMSGYSREEAIGRTPGELLNGPQTDAATLADIHEHIQRGERFEAELLRYHKSGRPYWASIDVQSVHDEQGKWVKYISIERDITQRKQAEQALREINETLERRVQERTQELIQANEKLSRSIDELRATQEQLVQAEKMAALGALVAGISHEINTPLGIGVTSATALQEEVEQLRREFEAGSLRRSTLQRFIAYGQEGTTILVRNLQRAAELIRSFKQVAVDQSSEERRTLDLALYIDEVILSLQPSFKDGRIRIVHTSQPGLVIETCPGAIAQILTNLLLNARIHAYDEQQAGTIQVQARRMGDEVEIVCADDGKGIAPEIRSRIFDPFFTTRRGSGGSGLGLHIVYNLVVSKLKGSIELISDTAAGAAFRMTFPARASVEEVEHESIRAR